MSLLIRYSFYLFLIAVFACNSPNSWDCFQTSGKEKVEKRTFENFNKIIIYDKLNVEIIQSDIYAIEIEAGENIIPGIKTKVSGDFLEIENKNTCELLRNSDKTPLVRVFFDTINYIQVFNSGWVRSIDTLKLNDLNLSKRSNGDMFLNLKSNNVFIYSNEYGDAVFNGDIKNISVEQEGVGLVDFSQCETEKGFVKSRGPGKTKIKVSQEIKGDLYGNGILEVYGNPGIRDVSIRDDAQLIFIEL